MCNIYKYIYLLVPKLSQAVIFLVSHHLPCLIFSSLLLQFSYCSWFFLYIFLSVIGKDFAFVLDRHHHCLLTNWSPQDPSYLLSIESSLLLLVLCNRTETWRIDERCRSCLSSTSLDARIFTTHQRFTQLPSKPYEATNVEIRANEITIHSCLRTKRFLLHF